MSVAGRMAPVRCRWSCVFGSSRRSRLGESWLTHTVVLCRRPAAVPEAGLLPDLGTCDTGRPLHSGVVAEFAKSPHDLVVPAATGLRPQHVPDRGAQDERPHVSRLPCLSAEVPSSPTRLPGAGWSTTVRYSYSLPDRVRRRSSIAQLAEHSTVNRRVAGSSPAGGATSGYPCSVLGTFAGSVAIILRGRPPQAPRCGWFLTQLVGRRRPHGAVGSSPSSSGPADPHGAVRSSPSSSGVAGPTVLLVPHPPRRAPQTPTERFVPHPARRASQTPRSGSFLTQLAGRRRPHGPVHSSPSSLGVAAPTERFVPHPACCGWGLGLRTRCGVVSLPVGVVAGFWAGGGHLCCFGGGSPAEARRMFSSWSSDRSGATSRRLRMKALARSWRLGSSSSVTGVGLCGGWCGSPCHRIGWHGDVFHGLGIATAVFAVVGVGVVVNLAFGRYRRSRKDAIVVGTSNRGSVVVVTSVPLVAWRFRWRTATVFRRFCTTYRVWPDSSRPSPFVRV